MIFKKAFTLAEVLITLSIIGLISVLTIPSLVKNYKYKLYSSSIEKAYSQITDAVQSVMNDEMSNDFNKTSAGVLNDGESCKDSTKGSCWFLRNYFKVHDKMVDCTSKAHDPNRTTCIADKYTSANGEGEMTHFGDCIQTTNGVSICLFLNPNNGITSVFVDTNGPAQPNMTGIDAFVMNISGSGEVVDWSSDPAKCNTKSSEYGNPADYATGCLTKVMNAGWKIED